MPKGKRNNPTMSKKTGIGENLEMVEREQLKLQKFKDNMVQDIKHLITNAKRNNSIQKLEFYVIHVNYFYSRKEDGALEEKYYPAEIALAEFNIQEGVTRIYNQIINEPISTGYTSAALEKSHQIPINSPLGKSNYSDIFNDIYEFIQPGARNGRLPPIYTLYTVEEVYKPAKSVLGRLAIADGKIEDYFELYSFEELFSIIHNANTDITAENPIDSVFAKILIEKDPYEYKKGLACEFHCTLDTVQKYCSLSMVQRWICVLRIHCSKIFNIELKGGVFLTETEGSHNKSNQFILQESIRASKSILTPLSMTGVSNEHRERVSQRSYEDEKKRRDISSMKPLEIIDYSKVFKKPQEPVERALRIPYTKSTVATADAESLDFTDYSFPSIDEGSTNRKSTKKSFAKGYAGCLK